MGDLKADPDCSINDAEIKDNKLTFTTEKYGSEVTTFEIINSSTLRMIDAEKIVLNLIK